MDVTVPVRTLIAAASLLLALTGCTDSSEISEETVSSAVFAHEACVAGTLSKDGRELRITGGGALPPPETPGHVSDAERARAHAAVQVLGGVDCVLWALAATDEVKIRIMHTRASPGTHTADWNTVHKIHAAWTFSVEEGVDITFTDTR